MNELYAIQFMGQSLPDPDFVFKNREEADFYLKYEAISLGKVVTLVVKDEIIYNLQSLKDEIRLQRKEIAGLREERRMILDNDLPPESKWKN